jgi:hypothetical protein
MVFKVMKSPLLNLGDGIQAVNGRAYLGASVLNVDRLELISACAPLRRTGEMSRNYKALYTLLYRF